MQPDGPAAMPRRFCRLPASGRVAGLLLAAALAGFAAASDAGAEFPYRAFITDNATLVRSGPGQAFYPTTRLMRGAEIEVYRQDEGGWLAIRPPAGSHCWVLSDFVATTQQEDVAEVTSPDAYAYVGSDLGDARDVVQVRLDQGERVHILGMQNVADEETGQERLWLKIAPPSGEFRWISNRHVSRSHPESAVARRGGSGDVTRNSSAEGPGSGAFATRPIPRSTGPPRSGVHSDFSSVAPAQHLELAPPGNLDPNPATEIRGPTGVGGPPMELSPLDRRRQSQEEAWKPRPAGPSRVRQLITAKGGGKNIANQAWATAGGVTKAMPETGLVDDGVVASPGSAAPGIPGALAVPSGGGSPITTVTPIGFGAPAYTGPLPSREDLELAFTRMVSLDPSQWRLPELRAQAVGVFQAATSTLDRGHAQRLIERIDQFLSLQNRRQAMLTETNAAAAPNAPHMPTPQPPSRFNPAATYPGQTAMPSPSAAGPRVSHTASPAPNPLKAITEKLLAPLSPLPGLGGSTGASAAGSSSGQPTYPNGAATDPATQHKTSHFDAVGWLMPVVYRQPQPRAGGPPLPSYAVTDEHGNVLALVAATPGVNLHRYERQRVGVRGETTTVITKPGATGAAGETKPMVSAVRVVTLDQTRR